jgi:hypothetical protein
MLQSGLSFSLLRGNYADRNDCERAFGLEWQISTRPKWHSFPSARCSVLQRSLTPPTLLEMAIFRQLTISYKPLIN